MAQPPTTADGGSSTDKKNAARGFRVDCTECNDLDGSTRYELFAERDYVADRHEHDTGHDVERTPASPEALTDGGVSEPDDADDQEYNDDWSGTNLTWGEAFLLKIEAEGRESVGEIGLLVSDKAAVKHLQNASGFRPPHDGKPSSHLMDETSATFETEHASLTATFYSDTHSEEDAEAVFSTIEDTLDDASRLDQIRVTVDEEWDRVTEGSDA